MLRTLLTGIFLLTGILVEDAAAQRRTPGQSPAGATEGTEVGIIARLGTKSYTSKMSGTCKHEPSASIYDLPAALWMVEAAGPEGAEVKQLNFTLWRPKNGSEDQISLTLDAGSKSARIDVNPRNKPVGAASVELLPVGPGGKFELKGKDATGTKVDLTISCPTFAGVVAEGG